MRNALAWVAAGAPVVFEDQYGRLQPVDWWWTAGGLAVLAVAVAFVRTRPVVSWLLAAGLSLAASPGLFTLSYGVALAGFALVLGLRAERARTALYAFAAVAAAGTALVPLRAPDPVMVWLVLLGTLLFGAVFPWLAGRYRRQDRLLVLALLDRAERLERERTMVAERARLRERARIAEDMHDALGHELSLIALRAGALQVAPGLAERHRAAAGEVRAAAADATDRLREIIGVLRDTGSSAGSSTDPCTGSPAGLSAGPSGGRAAAPLAPAGESIAALVDRAAGSGLRVRLTGEEEGPAGTAGLPEPVDRAAHRVVQEALTNAAKHAPGAAVTVTVERGPEAVTVTVVNEPPPDRPDGVPEASAGPGGGSGLAALRERVRLVGGEFGAGARPGGGFEVSARLPYDAGHRPASEPAPGLPPGPGVGTEERRDAMRRLAREQRAGRRRVLTASAVAGGAAVAVVAAVIGWYAHTTAHSVLPPGTYEGLRTGDAEAEVRRVLPDRVVTDPPVDRAPAPPAGARCEYYRADGELFTSVATYRLCFADGRLTEKTVVPTAGGSGDGRHGHDGHRDDGDGGGGDADDPRAAGR